MAECPEPEDSIISGRHVVARSRKTLIKWALLAILPGSFCWCSMWHDVTPLTPVFIGVTPYAGTCTEHERDMAMAIGGCPMPGAWLVSAAPALRAPERAALSDHPAGALDRLAQPQRGGLA